MYMRPRNNEDIFIYKVIDMACIPFDEKNNDYKEYLKWVEEGNIAEEWNLGGI